MTRYRLELFRRWFFGIPLVFLLTGCPPRDDLVVNFEASPETIVLGESAELRWQIIEGTPPFELSLSPPVADELVSPLTVSPAVTTTYTLTVNDAAGKSEVAHATITVVDDIGIDAFTAEVNSLEVTFSWTLIGETPIACTLDPGDGSEVLELPDCTSPTTYRYDQAGNYDAQLTLANGVSATENVNVPPDDETPSTDVGIRGFVDEQSRNVIIILTDEGEQTVSVDSLNRNIARVQASYGYTASNAAIRGLNAAVLGLLQNVPTSVMETPNVVDLSREFVVAVDTEGNVEAVSPLSRAAQARLEFSLTLPTEQDVALLIAESDGLGGWVCKGPLEYQRVQNKRTVASEQVIYRFDNSVAGRDDLRAGAFAFNELTANLAARNDDSGDVSPSEEVQTATIPVADAPDFQDGIYRFCNNDNLAREDVRADLDWRSDIFNVSELPPETNPDLAAGEAAVYDFAVALLLEPQRDGSNRLVATSPINENGNLRAEVVRSAADNLDATLFFTDVAFFDADKRRFPLTPTYQFDAQAQIAQSSRSLSNIPDSDIIDLGVIDGGLGYISGRVRRDDGTPVPSASVIIVLDGERVAFNVAVSDENGFYELLIPSDTEGRYILYAQNETGTLAGIASNDNTGVRYVVGSSDIFNQDIILDVPISADTTISANRPVVDAGANQISNGGTVLLTGTASDPDGNTLSVRWQVLSRPEGSDPRLSTPNALVTRFDADTPGIYRLRLSAFDGALYAADLVTVTVRLADTPPAVDAGADTTTTPGVPITLAGSAFDTDGDPLTLSWVILSSPAGSNPQLSNPNSNVTQFSADVVGDYVLEITASDGQTSSRDTVTVQVRGNAPPQVNAGDDVSTTVGVSFTLVGTAEDPDGDTLTVTWQVIDAPADSDPQFGEPNATTTTFSTNLPGSYRVQFSASDGINPSVSDSLTIQVEPTGPDLPPLVAAFFEQNGDFLPPDTTIAEPGSSVNLLGAISDLESDTLTITWQVISAPNGSDPQLSVEEEVVTIPGISSQVATLFSANLAGEYVIRLTAVDDAGNVSSDALTVIVNTPPIVEVGEDVSVKVGSSITLEGSAEDPDNDPLTITWRVTDQPVGSDDSSFQLSNLNDRITDFSADVAGEYVLTLTASDGINPEVSDSLTVQVITNNPPQVNILNDNVSIEVGSSITLRGSAFDPDGDPLTYNWQVIDPPDDSEPPFGNPNAEETTFSTDLPGSYQVQFSAFDGEVSVSDSLTIQVEPIVIPNNPPQVQAFFGNAGSIVAPGSSLTLEGFVNDPDGDTLTITWEVDSEPDDSDPQLSVESAFVTGSGDVATNFSADVAGDYVITLTASDGEDSRSDSLTVTVNEPPIVNAGPDTTATCFTNLANLAGSANDFENDPLTYTWQVVALPGFGNPNPQFGNPNAPTTTFTSNVIGNYTLRLTASDGTNSASDEVVVTIPFC